MNGQAASYDFENHLVSLGSVASYVYDADGNRVSVSNAGTTTTYAVDTSLPYASVIEEYAGASATPSARYDYGDDLVRMDRGGVYYYLYDGLGSTRQLVNTAGAVTDSYGYSAFGEMASHTGSTVNPFLFNAQQFDQASGDYYLRARYYDQSNGRFLSQDPFGGTDYDPVTLHRYLYASCDSIDRIDPSGCSDLFIAYRGSSVHSVIGADFLNKGVFGTRFANYNQISALLGLPLIAKLTSFKPDLIDMSNPFRRPVFEIKPFTLNGLADGIFDLARNISILNAVSTFCPLIGNGLPTFVPGNCDDYTYDPVLIAPIPDFGPETFHTQTAIVFPPINGLILYDVVDSNWANGEVRLRQSQEAAQQAQALARTGASAEELETLVGRATIVATLAPTVAPLVTTAIAATAAQFRQLVFQATTAPLLGF